MKMDTGKAKTMDSHYRSQVSKASPLLVGKIVDNSSCPLRWLVFLIKHLLPGVVLSVPRAINKMHTELSDSAGYSNIEIILY